MKFLKQSEYGIRVLLELASVYGSGPQRLVDIAKRTKISHKYLEQIISHLKRAEIVACAWGPHGGYALAKPPETINMSEVLAVLEGPTTQFDCSVHKSHNSRCAACFMKSLWHKMDEAVNDVLAKANLAEIAAKSIRAK